MKNLTEQQRHRDGEQGQPSDALERADQVLVAPKGLVERAHPHDEDEGGQDQPVKNRQVAGSGEALGQIAEGLDGVRTGLHPVVGRNLDHLLKNLLLTASIAIFLMLVPGLPGVIAFVEWYASFAAIVAVFVVAPWAICEAIMNTWRKSRNLPPQALFLSRDEVTDFEIVLPYLHTARAVFTMVSLSFFAANAASPNAGYGVALELMLEAAAISSVVADAIPLLIIFRFRKEYSK